MKRPDSAKMLFKDFWFRIRREPHPESGLREKPSVWIDFYYKEDWKESRAATSAMLAVIDLQKDIAFGLFMNAS